MGWPTLAVLKQERYEAYQEALALTDGQKPTQALERGGRRVEIWDVPSVRFTDSYPGPVRVVRVRERWTGPKQVGQESKQEEKEQNWIWVVEGDLEGYDGAAIRDIGHLQFFIIKSLLMSDIAACRARTIAGLHSLPSFPVSMAKVSEGLGIGVWRNSVSRTSQSIAPTS